MQTDECDEARETNYSDVSPHYIKKTNAWLVGRTKDQRNKGTKEQSYIFLSII